MSGIGISVPAGDILPPEEGIRTRSMVLQALFTGLVLLAAAGVLLRGLRSGIERASRILTPILFLGLLVIIGRSLTLPGSAAGLHWYILKFEPSDLTPTVALAALGQVVFSLALGGTFMVVYGSYLNRGDPLGSNALATVAGDTAAGLLAGLAIFPAVLALGLEPDSGPALIFQTLPRVFGEIPAGWIFGTVFFLALAGAAFLSGIAALEVLVAGLTDNTRLNRRGATWIMVGAVFILAFPPMVNLRVFVPWDLTFGSGAQTAGALAAVLAVGWGMERGAVIEEWVGEERAPHTGRRGTFLYQWIRWVIPGAMIAVGVWWLLTEVLGVAAPG
jgi:NSS family neurotransmitter:Na+ symporter